MTDDILYMDPLAQQPQNVMLNLTETLPFSDLTLTHFHTPDKRLPTSTYTASHFFCYFVMQHRDFFNQGPTFVPTGT